MSTPTQWSSLRKTSTWATATTVVLFTTVALLQTAWRYAKLKWGSADYWFDAGQVWIPLANRVLSGTPLYTGKAVDNKPPLWQFLNLTADASGHYPLVMFGLVGLANAMAALLLARWLTKDCGVNRGTAALAGLFFLAALPAIHGTIINVRSFALVGVLAAIQTRSPVRSGAAISAATLFSQFAAFGIPVLILRAYRNPSFSDTWSWVGRFCFSGLGVAAIAFGAVYAVWGWPSFVGSLKYSFYASTWYVQRPLANPLTSPVGYLRRIIQVMFDLSYLLIPAGGAVMVTLRGRLPMERQQSFLLGLTAAFLAPLLVKSLLYYWMHVLPFLSALGALGVEWGLQISRA